MPKSKLFHLIKHLQTDYPGTPWMWSSELPYCDYRLQYGSALDRSNHDVPHILRGSKATIEMYRTPISRWRRAVDKLIYKARLTTPYKFQIEPGQSVHSKRLDSIFDMAWKIAPRSKGEPMCYFLNNAVRYQDGKLVAITNACEEVAYCEYKEIEKFAKQDCFWSKQKAAAEMLQTLKKMKA